MSSFNTIGRGTDSQAAIGLLGLAAIPVRTAHINVNANYLRRVLLATLTATVALSSLVLPVRGAGAAIIASATGSGHTTAAGELRTFSFVARMDADGVATGTAQVDNRAINEMFQLTVDCINVVGSLAIISGVITRHTDVHAIGLVGIFAVQDSGEGSAPPADLVTQVFFFRPGVLTCADLGPADAAPFLVAIDAGNVQVN
jgi:hypothetical protein